MKLLLGYENSNASTQALNLAKKYAKAFKATVCVLTTTPYGPELAAPEFDDVQNKLTVLKDDLEKEGIACETHLITRSLSPGEDLVDFARKMQIDKIFLGIKKKSKIGKLILGSTAQYVVLEAPCPVIVVK